MNTNRIILFLGLILSVFTGYGQFESKVVDVGNIGITVTNVGTFGYPDVRNDPEGGPSMEYPVNSGIEHLFEAGIWIGALVDGQTRVSTGSIDAPSGYSTGNPGFEITAELGAGINERSSLTNSDFFSFNAISHQDLLMDFSDKNSIIPGTNIIITDHDDPLDAQIHLETYAWNFSFADYFMILNYTITNESNEVWDSVYLGMYSDLVVRNINVATDAGAAFFSKKGGGYIDSLGALYCFDVTGEPEFTSSYGSSIMLGTIWRDLLLHPSNADSIIANGYPVPKFNGNFWKFQDSQDPDFPAPENELGRYEKMKNGLDFKDPSIVNKVQQPDNRVQLNAFGPISEIQPGESVQFVMALVAAKTSYDGNNCGNGPISQQTGPDMDLPCAKEQLANNLGWAVRTFNGEDLNGNGILDEGEDLDDDDELDRFILPEPPATPKFKIVPTNAKVELYWDDRAEESIDPISKKKDFEGYRLYRTQIGEDFSLDLIGSADLIAQWDNQGNNIGINNGFDKIELSNPVTFTDDSVQYTYKYELENLVNGWQYLFILTAFDQGDEELQIESLESSFVENAYSVFPGTDVNDFNAANAPEVGVYPNPYRLNAAWDGTTARTRKIYFYNLPAQCEIVVYTLSGDVVARIEHDAGTYNGDDILWFDNFGGNEDNRVFSGGEHAWDILSESSQDITQGLYMFSVKDLNSNKIQKGKFAIIK